MKNFSNIRKLSLSLFSLICIFGFGLNVYADDTYMYPSQSMEFTNVADSNGTNVCKSFNKSCVSANLNGDVCTLRGIGQSCEARVSIGENTYEISVGKIYHVNMSTDGTHTVIFSRDSGISCSSFNTDCVTATSNNSSSSTVRCVLKSNDNVCSTKANIGNSLYYVNVNAPTEEEEQTPSGGSQTGGNTGSSSSSGSTGSTGSGTSGGSSTGSGTTSGGSSQTGGNTGSSSSSGSSTGNNTVFQLGPSLNFSQNFATDSCSGTCGVANYFTVDGNVNITANAAGNCTLTCKTSEAISNFGVDSYQLKIDVASDGQGGFDIKPQAIINTAVGGVVLDSSGVSMTSPGAYYICDNKMQYIGSGNAIPENCFYSLIQFAPGTISTTPGNDVSINNVAVNVVTDIVTQVISQGSTANLDQIISTTLNKYSGTALQGALNLLLGEDGASTITNILNTINTNNGQVNTSDIINALLNNGNVSGVLGANPNGNNLADSSDATKNACTSLKIFHTGFYPSTVDGFKGFGTYGGQSGIHLYTATANCANDTTTVYDAFCVDPALYGPHQVENGDSRSYYTITDTVDLTTTYGKAIYILYRDYYANTGKTDKDLYIATQVSRFLMAKLDDQYNFLGLNNGPYKDKAQAYIDSAITSDVRAVYEDVLQKAQSEDFSSSNIALDITHESGDDVATGIKFKIVATGVTDISKVTNLSISVLDNNTKKDISSSFTISNGNWQQDGDKYTLEVTVTASSLDDSICDVILVANAKYNGENDVANIGIATSTSSTGSLQRFLIFNKGGTSDISASENFKVSKNCNSNSACTPTAVYSCDDAASVTYVVEGTEAEDENVEWEACIIGEENENGTITGGKDPNGNTYELQEDNGYCAIYCKEDYAFKVPGNLDQYSANGNGFAQGRYISINLDKHYHAVAGLAGQKTCVTSEILTEKFLNDAVTSKNDLLDAVNRYYKYKAQKEALENSNYLSNNGNVSNPTCTGSCEGVNMSGYESVIGETSISYTYPVYTFEASGNGYEIVESNIVTNSNSNDSILIPGSREESTVGTGENTAVVVHGTQSKDQLYNSVLSEVNKNLSEAESDYREALNKLNTQVDNIQDCTTWAEEDKLKESYEFDPEIRFDYAEEEYISMMNGNNQLQPEADFDSSTLSYFCEDNKETVVETGSCPNSVSDDKTITVKVPSASIESATESTDEVYYEYRRITGIVKYGDPGVALDGTRSDPELIYYKSSVPFYTHPNKGIVTTEKTEDSTLVDQGDPNRNEGTEPDGLVYPIKLTTPAGVYDYTITFKNIGQYFMSDNTLGRIMGESNGQSGYLTVNESDSYLCNYTVCAIDDPNCDNVPDSNAVCSNILASDVCKSDDTADLDDCIAALLEEECCDEVISLNKMTINMVDQYNAVCPKQKYCQGFGIIDGSTSGGAGGSAVMVDGKLEFTPKSVSLNNLFPNAEDSRGFNWVGTTYDGTSIGSIIEEIENAGESIYNDDPDFKIVINPSCRAQILEYNDTQESSSLGLNDYTLNMNSDGTYDTSTFLAQLEAAGCIVEKGFE